MSVRHLEMPIAVTTGADVVFEGQRKPRRIEVRADLVVNIAAIAGAEAPLVARSHTTPCPAISRSTAATIDFNLWEGRLRQKSLSYRTAGSHADIDETALRSILAATPGELLPANSIIKTQFNRPPNVAFGRYCDRDKMPTLTQVGREMPIREIVDDGMAAANRTAGKIAKALVLVDGVVRQTASGPFYAVADFHSGAHQVIVPLGTLNDYPGPRLFGPHRADDADAMCEWLARRRRKTINQRTDAIEVVAPELLPNGDGIVVSRQRDSDIWSSVGELLNALPADDLMRWARLRDLQISLRKGHLDDAAPVMVAFRDFVAALEARPLAPYYADLRSIYLKAMADNIHRIVDCDLPRLGIAPGQSALSPADETAIAGMADLDAECAEDREEPRP